MIHVGQEDAMAQVSDAPDKIHRPRAYEINSARYQWNFTYVPEFIRHDGKSVENPFRKAAIFVVHGIGEQESGETAAALRTTLEDVVQEIQPTYSAGSADNWIVPQPYIKEGNWAQYDDLATMAAEEWTKFTEQQKQFFLHVWFKRCHSALRCVLWLVTIGLRLIRKSKGIAQLYYLYLMPLLWMIAVFMLAQRRTRQLLTDFVNDARLYLEPKGDLEHEIVQRIDSRVGSFFLRLLGYDWNFDVVGEKVGEEKRIVELPYKFERVCWVAHSLGTVISYNVLGDILHRCLEMRKRGEEKAQISEKVENGLAGFITLGSPLDKIAFLYENPRNPHGNDVLRKWPVEYLPGGQYDLWKRGEKTGGFWQNFLYTSDPVSGWLDAFCLPTKKDESKSAKKVNPINLVKNYHTSGSMPWGIPHIVYWNDKQILSRIMLHTFQAPFVKPHELKTRSEAMQELSLFASGIFWAVAALVTVSIVIYGFYGTVSPWLSPMLKFFD